eukprot:TRINITY_DN24107_c0_g1_i1.p1 TRINITY_DN24107_c0_g1~~TRINITY_DN24107_c0_g1_i1.p1  ORF type:complete len:825 (-),score=86.62 TRINITY_DN24107_c0_g1_i1:14-2488(-)
MISQDGDKLQSLQNSLLPSASGRYRSESLSAIHSMPYNDPFEEGPVDDSLLSERAQYASFPHPRQARGGMCSCFSQVPAIVVTNIMTIIYSITYGRIIFTTPALGHAQALLPSGVHAWLMAGILAQTSLLFTSRLPCGIAGGMMELIPIVHSLFESTARDIGDVSAAELAGTCMACSLVATIGSGLLLTAGLRLGVTKYLRRVPVVALKGALFGVAIFLLRNSITAATEGAGAHSLWEAKYLWFPAILAGVILFVVDEVVQSRVTIAMMLVLLSSLPWLAVALGLTTDEELRSNGWLFPLPDTYDATTWYEQFVSSYASTLPHVHWRVVWKQLPGMLGLWMTYGLCVLMDLKANEMLTSQELHLRSELKAIGIGSIFSCLSGATWPVYMPTGLNVTSFRLGGSSKLVGATTIVGQLAMLFVVQDIMPHLPRTLPAAVSWWLGMAFMKGSLLDICHQYAKKSDIVIVVFMALLMIFVGFVECLIVGIIASLLMFTLQYSEAQSLIRAAGDGRFFRSNAFRTSKEYKILERHAREMIVLFPDCYLMFGNSPQFIDEVRSHLLPEARRRIVVLSFKGVRSLDYSAGLDLIRLDRVALDVRSAVVITEVNDDVLGVLNKLGAPLRVPHLSKEKEGSRFIGIHYIEHYHLAMKYCEDRILQLAGYELQRPPVDASPDVMCMAFVKRVFSDIVHDTRTLDELTTCFKMVEYEADTTLWREGEKSTFCVGVASGELHAFQASRRDPNKKHLCEVVGVGGIIGHGSLLSRMDHIQTVWVPAKGQPCICVTLSWTDLRELMESRHRLALLILRAFAHRNRTEFRDLVRLATHV